MNDCDLRKAIAQARDAKGTPEQTEALWKRIQRELEADQRKGLDE